MEDERSELVSMVSESADRVMNLCDLEAAVELAKRVNECLQGAKNADCVCALAAVVSQLFEDADIPLEMGILAFARLMQLMEE